MTADATAGTGLLVRPVARPHARTAPVQGAYGGARLVAVKMQDRRRVPPRTGLLRELR
jgi:hypothetical protein